MKAIKLYNIEWDLNNLSDEEKDKVLETLPKNKGFVVNDDFVAVEKIPALLKKKYGYDFISYSISEIPIIEDFDDLLDYCAGKSKENKDHYKVSGELSDYGQSCYSALKFDIAKRVKLEKEGTSLFDMPKELDVVMLALEKITGEEWTGDMEASEWINILEGILQKKVDEAIVKKEEMKVARKEAKKKLKAEMKAKKAAEKAAKKDEGDSDFEDEGDSDFDDEDEEGEEEIYEE